MSQMPLKFLQAMPDPAPLAVNSRIAEGETLPVWLGKLQGQIDKLASWAYGEKATTASAGSSTPTDYLVFTTPALSAGTYLATASLMFSAATATMNCAFPILIDGVSLLPTNPTSRVSVANTGIETVFAQRALGLSAGAHVVKVQFANKTDTNSITMRFASVGLSRVA